MVALTEQRAAAQRERDAALSTLKALSGDIGKAMKTGAAEADVAALKAEVAASADVAEGAEATMAALEEEANALFAALPNLLDDATPDGAGETENVVVADGGARLERALGAFFLDMHTDGGGYEEVSSPVIVARSALEGTGQLPKFEDDLFKLDNHKVRGEDAFLIPTAEVPLTNLVAGDILEESDLPIRVAALTHCFR
ncbi:hypothetical protein JL720_8134 [Aureococcus anophagefferens]|nr:hypothetical protein JL720_8134 [Aureococcus anophagefferens]